MKRHYVIPTMEPNSMDTEKIIALSGGETPIGGETDEFDVKGNILEENPFE